MADKDCLIKVFKKKLEKAIINEFYVKEIINFQQFNNIIKRVDEDINRLETMILVNDKMKKIVIKIPV